MGRRARLAALLVAGSLLLASWWRKWSQDSSETSRLVGVVLVVAMVAIVFWWSARTARRALQVMIETYGAVGGVSAVVADAEAPWGSLVVTATHVVWEPGRRGKAIGYDRRSTPDARLTFVAAKAMVGIRSWEAVIVLVDGVETFTFAMSRKSMAELFAIADRCGIACE